ncbi:heterokaryon incompatibility protein-domain-containing protein, partial [Colletotrichum phormii]
MHLINVRTRLLEEFHANIPKYAILSHTWGTDEEEISFRDIKSGFISKPGLGTVKFDGCLRQAKADGLSYVWIDTCCIDKTNANELGEAINSMFRWYQAAKTCYAFLQDVPSKDESAWKTRFRKSRWFTRGWTLQELLAPSELMFYSSDWRALGTKLQLSSVVGGITGIPAQFLLGASNLREASVAQRMSWASRRQTKRVEDIAYSLLGIFNVMIPMIYGEGTQAFIRLQQEIINATTDDSILAWDLSSKVVTFDPQSRPRNLTGGILAISPAAFAECGKITSGEHRTPTIEQGISRGYLKLQLPLYSGPLGETYGLLNC